MKVYLLDVNKRITDIWRLYFGDDLMKKVQKYIIENYYGEQPVGTSFIIETGVKNIKLIHTPTMRIPSKIKEPMVVYQAMRTSLMTALNNEIESIVIPAFGGCCGFMNLQELCELMYEGYKQIMNSPKELNWRYATRWEPEVSDKWKY